ncbi:MAG: hypothetical protein ABIH86_06630 [Planctomycetota bacterium]
MIRLRPYYLYSLLRQLAAGDEPLEENGLPDVARRLKASRFTDDIQLVNTFCDACENCVKKKPEPDGCLWGEDAVCISTDTGKRLNQVEDQMRSILYDLEMRFGDSMRADRLILRAIERRPFHYFYIPDWQAAYEKGIMVFSQLTGLTPMVDETLLAKKKYYWKYMDAQGETPAM